MSTNIDFSNGFVLLRILCGLFLFPHAIGKFTAREASFNFFRAAGFHPPAPFAYAAMVLEVILGSLLVLGIYAHVVALITSIYLLIATAAVIKVERKWLWHIGGCEFPFFWALCCALVAHYG